MLKVHLVQMESAAGEQDLNLKRARDLVLEAGIDQDSLVIFPEMFSTGYIPQDTEMFKEDFNGDNPGKTAKFLAQLARETKCHILGAGICRREGLPTNHASLYSWDFPSEKSYYDKIHLFFPEQSRFAAGEKINLFKINGLTIAPSICYDLRFPELYRQATMQGAELLTIQAAWPAKRRSHWESLIRARAIENQAFVAAVNCITPDGSFTGNSMIVNPLGETIAEAESGKECILSALIDPAEVKSCRSDFPVLKDTRLLHL